MSILLNSIHYIDNNDTAFDNQLVLMDVGAEHMGYTADVTRTIPANGKYSNEQRELYEIVYEAQSAGIESAVVGAKFSDVYQACYNVIANSRGGQDQPSLLKLVYIDTIGYHI